MYPIAAALIAVVASAALVETLRRPFVWVLLVLALTALYLVFAWRGRRRVLAYNACVVLLGLLVLEGYYQWRERTVVCEPSLSGPHPELGYAPLPDRRVSCRRTSRGQLLYDVVYTIGPSGWRVSPPQPTDPSAGCVVFLGGSFTFAQGVPDEAAMPYRFGLETAGRHRVYNVSFKGYGPHHVLAALEDGVVEQAVSCVPTHVIYQTIPHHVVRATGLANWGYRAPRYRLGSDGAVVRDGFFGDGHSRFRRALERRLRRSFLVEEVANRAVRSEPRHLELFHGIVGRAHRLVAERFPGAEFHVLAWDPGAPAGFVEGLEAQGVAVHRISRVLPGLDAEGRPFRIHRREGHPNADAHARIARYVADAIAPPRGSPGARPKPEPRQRPVPRPTTGSGLSRGLRGIPNPMKWPAVAAGVLIASIGWAAPSGADWTEARCDIYPKGSDRLEKMIPCTFGQRQGAVTITRDDGVTHELAPVGDAPGHYRDEHGRPVYRQSGLGAQGQIYRFDDISIYVYWDTSALNPSEGDNPTAPFSTADYDATTLLRCKAAGEAEYGSCPAGILRMEDRQASVVIRSQLGEKFTINFMTGYVNATHHEVEARREGDTWIVVLDNGEVYEVPLAAIEGG